MKPFGENIWLFDGPSVPFFGLPYSTRMTVVRLNDDELWVHSPIALTPELQQQVSGLGTVTYLIAPNKLHYLFLAQWQAAFPESRLYVAPGVEHKLTRLQPPPVICQQLAEMESATSPWTGDIEQLIFSGSSVMQEAVFFHHPSKTLILTDLIENFPPEHFKSWQRPLARITGILAPNGRTPLDWRLSFSTRKAEARDCLGQMLAWAPEKIVLAHGLCIEKDGSHFLRRSFDWLL
ncbi:DUF4336 domain-containing protein [Shewanella sedimentimangrovi]|uniref:DUF4336 domain-containing protein n=1 Tax=Shewanella sedimentimangrovi TaxID=2814293 RepID=A0ABX7R455_9GAMM|nr:DUF4336 domain-containing protein [Shewanella sedimentimangrovi]QSX38612.1 DUF4336 domain-containing protein [Shewanella sedimentimangrovi]